MNFLKKVEPYILSDDNITRDFALRSIHEGLLGTEQTFLLALDALDKLTPNAISNPIIPYTRELPLTEKVLVEIINRLEKRDGNFHWYLSILNQCDLDLLAKYKEQLEAFVNKEALNQSIELLSLTEEELFEAAAEVRVQLEEEEYFNQTLFNNGKRIFQELIKRGTYDEENFRDIEAGVKSELDDDYYSINGIYNVYLAGEQKVTSLIPVLAQLLIRDEEGVLLEQIEEALIKIGNDEVVREVEKYMQTEYAVFSAIEILKNIKLPIAEETLLRHFNQVTDNYVKTLIAEALCYHLSTDAIPLIDKMIEEGYDETVLDPIEPLYANCVINGVDHPKLQSWKNHLQEKKAFWEQKQKERNRLQAKKQGIGRNDPCICGSGKKFKKCCGA